MTRINIDFPVKNLTGKHLIAEHREIKRIPNMVASERANLNNIPDKFCLGKGHVSWFYNKLGYLLNRYRQLYQECLRRGYNVQNYETAWDGVPEELMGDYKPTEEDKKLIVDRINSKLINK